MRRAAEKIGGRFEDLRFRNRLNATIASILFAPIHRHRSPTPAAARKSFRNLLASRQREMEACAAAFNILRLDFSAMRFND